MTEPETSPDLFRRWYLSSSQRRRIVSELGRWVTGLRAVPLPDPTTLLQSSELPAPAHEVRNSGTSAVACDCSAIAAETEAVIRWVTAAIESTGTILSNGGAGGAERTWQGRIRWECAGEAASDTGGDSAADGVSLVLLESVVDGALGIGQLVDLSRNVVCGGAIPIGVLAVDWVRMGDETGSADALEPYLRVCTVLGIDAIQAHSTREYSEGQIRQPRWLMIGVVCQRDLAPAATLEGEGDSILLLGEPVDRSAELQGLDPGVWWNQVRQQPCGEIRPMDVLKESERHDALRMLLLGGRIRSAMICGRGGMAWSVMSAVSRGAESMGASLDLTELLSSEGAKEGEAPVRWDALWFGEPRGRVLVTTSALDAGKVMAQARILGVPATMVGRTGGGDVRLRLPAGEVVWPLERVKTMAARSLDRGAPPAGGEEA